jgi:hypothetical protein
MGMNCGPDSPLVRAYCLDAGVCGVGPVSEVVSSAYLSPSGFKTVLAESHEIVKSLFGITKPKRILKNSGATDGPHGRSRLAFAS